MFVVIKQSTPSMKFGDNNFNNTRLNGTTLLTKHDVAVLVMTNMTLNVLDNSVSNIRLEWIIKYLIDW